MLTSAVRLLIVVPARIASSRLPGKPLRRLAGEPLIRIVCRSALQLAPDAAVVVASDDERVLDAVAPLGVRGVLTDARHASGTERVAEVAARPEFAGVDVVVNVQGDLVGLTPGLLDAAVARVAGGDPIGTAGRPLGARAARDPNRVKVVADGAGHALRFARRLPASAAWDGDVQIVEHVGIYAHTPPALARWVRLPPVAAELSQGLEQLRPLAHGVAIGVGVVADAPCMSIDTEDDLARAEAALAAAPHGGMA